MYTTEVKFGPILGAGSLIGLGMGGFFDGIIFHQIFQMHTLISTKVPPNSLDTFKINLFWDGVFHLFTWFTAMLGIGFLWNANLNPYSPKSTQAFAGSVVLGAGLFNVIEGLINHILLKVHHLVENVSDREIFLWDMLYIGVGAVLIGIGRIMISQGKRNYFIGEIERASRKRDIRFKPAFRRQTHQVRPPEDTLQ